MTRKELKRSPSIKRYYDRLVKASGLNNREIAKQMGITFVTLSTMSFSVDTMKVYEFIMLTRILRVPPCEMLEKLEQLRQIDNDSNDLEA